MFYTPSIQIQNLSYVPSDVSRALFYGLNLQFGQEKIGIVGRNGVGKSTLLKLITGELEVSAGSISSQGVISYLPQIASFQIAKTVAAAINIEEKLAALKRIQQGSSDESDYEILNDDWLVEDRAKSCLDTFDLSYLSLEQSIDDLSGGEQTRLSLTRIFMDEPDFLLLDEPTNHLDQHSRELFYNAIDNFSGGVIVASHDRALLNKMDKIVELTSLGAATYGGNFDDYVRLKAIEKDAAQHTLDAEIKILDKAKATIQKRFEKHQKNEAKGNRNKKNQILARGSYDKLEIKSAKGRSEKTNKRIRVQAERKTEDINRKLLEAKTEVEELKELKIRVNSEKIPTNKIVLDCQKISFFYGEDTEIIKDFNFSIVGSERIAIAGDNGTGKTTLIKLILGEIKPKSGLIKNKVDSIRYLDQHCALLKLEFSVLDNFKYFNPTLSDFECRSYLAQFLFRNIMVDKKTSELSGGERLRALLACILMSSEPEQLLILDEPTNHLDLESIEIFEEALKQFQGAMLVISHDPIFLKNIGIDKTITAPFASGL